MNGVSTVLIFLGLFLLGGAYSFHKQKLPRSVVLVLGIGAVMAVCAGVLRLEAFA